MVAVYLLGAFFSKEEKAETYLDAAAILGLVVMFIIGRGMSLPMFAVSLLIYMAALFTFYYFRLFKKGVRSSSKKWIPDILLLLAIISVKDIVFLSVACCIYLLVERYLFYKKFHSLF